MDELIQRFNENAVRYLVFGGQAVRLEGMPRFSMDWDLFIPGKGGENGVLVKTFSLEDLIASKAAVGRPQDLEDVDFLKIRKQSKS